MTIEELAFKDRRTLAHLNEKDLLDIIEFLQDDRKQWINQFAQTHNESVEIQEENQGLKKQLEEYQKDIKDLDNQNKRAFENMQLNQLKVCNMIKQQKEFINWLEDEINIEKDNLEKVCKLYKISKENNSTYKFAYSYINKMEEILQKYKSIIGDDK